MTTRSADLDVTASARLREAGHRYTSGRRLLVQLLARSGQPMTIPEILDRRPGLAQSSAYRNLAVLEQARLVRRLVTNEEYARFELAEDLTEHHHHLVCSNCGAVEDVRVPPRLERSMERALEEMTNDSGFSAVSHRLDLIGTCRACG